MDLHVKRVFALFILLLVSCAPLVPYDQVPGGQGYDPASNRAMAEALLRQAELQEQQMTQAAVMTTVPMTQTVAALQVQGTEAAFTSTAGVVTQQAAATQTAVWWTPTPNMTGTLDALAISAAQTQTTLNLQREQDINDFKGKLPAYSFVIVVLVLGIVLMLIIRRNRYQAVKVDARGNVLPVLDLVDGLVTDFDRNPNHQGSVSRDLLVRILAHIVEQRFGMKPLLPEITAARQDATTERDQMIDLATRGLPGPSSETKEMKKLAGQQMVKQLSDTNLASRFKILDGTASNLDVIDGHIVQVLDDEWKEAVKK